MNIIQDTEQITIYRDLFHTHEVRLVKMKGTGAVHILAEDLAQLIGYKDAHDMMSSTAVLDVINFAELETGIYPLVSIEIQEAAKLFSELHRAPFDLSETLDPHDEQLFKATMESELKDDLQWVAEGNPTLVDVDVVRCTVKSTSGRDILIGKEFAIRLWPHPEDGWLTLTVDDLERMTSILKDYQPGG